MMRRERQDRTGLRGLMAVLLGLVLMLRLIAAPIVLSAPHPGLIAICSGGGVYYVTLDGEPVGGDAPEGDPCPYLGIPLGLPGRFCRRWRASRASRSRLMPKALCRGGSPAPMARVRRLSLPDVSLNQDDRIAGARPMTGAARHKGYENDTELDDGPRHGCGADDGCGRRTGGRCGRRTGADDGP